MQIMLNGKPQVVDDASSVADLLAQLGWTERRVAVEVNAEIVPRGQHAERQLQDGDRVELVTALGGG
ncbi:MAG: sulfur carrier protein ThiS [Aquimonas sp.]|jgi:sulfur carrier protein|nr:sulfur carrier protein ThiS [Aquimonas sp.]